MSACTTHCSCHRRYTCSSTFKCLWIWEYQCKCARMCCLRTCTYMCWSTLIRASRRNIGMRYAARMAVEIRQALIQNLQEGPDLLLHIQDPHFSNSTYIISWKYQIGLVNMRRSCSRDVYPHEFSCISCFLPFLYLKMSNHTREHVSAE